jgi:hypothetical protein
MKLYCNYTLSAYEFACGYVEKYESMETIPYHVTIASPSFWSTLPKCYIKLYNTCGVYFVEYYIRDISGNCIRQDKAFDTLKNARIQVSKFRKEAKELK